MLCTFTIMIQVEDKIVAFDLFEKQFACDLSACKGGCCVEGDAGAPLKDHEIKILSKIYDEIKPYMRSEGVSEIKKQGLYVIDSEGDKTTPLIEDNECAFVVFDKKKIAKCAIEIAYNDKKIDFKKPISCHLFPARVHKYRDFDAINYESIKICAPACVCGGKLEIPVYKFLKEPLIRAYGKKWYDALCYAAKEVKKAFLNAKR